MLYNDAVRLAKISVKNSGSCIYTVVHTTLQKPYVHNRLVGVHMSSCDIISGERVGLYIMDGVWRQWTLLTSYCVAYKIHKILLQKHWSQFLMGQSGCCSGHWQITLTLVYH